MHVKFKLIDALKQIELEKGLAMDTVLDALKDALLTAYKKNYGDLDETREARIDIDEVTGDIRVFEDIENEKGEMEEAEVTPENFGRIAAQTAKQVIIQRIREAERELMFDEYHEPRYAPPPLLKRMVLAGMYGKKSGRGFYDYSATPPVVADVGL